jgi:hypothetical protein
MDVNSVDLAIRDTIQAINAGTAEEPMYCGWTLAMRTRANLIIQDISHTFPILIQFIEEEDDPNVWQWGDIRTIDFYLFTKMPETNDVLTIKAIFNALKAIVNKFQVDLGEMYQNEFEGLKISLIDQLGIDQLQDIGIQFTLKLKVQAEC